MIKALCGLGRVISNVNIPNTGRQIVNLPEPVRQLILPHVENHERIMKVVAGGNRDTELVTEAFLNDPLVKGRASEEEVRRLVKDMMEATVGA